MQNTSHAVMAQRAELKNSLDDFPTPPWATRALVEHVIVSKNSLREMTCLEPACGRGHMSVALAPYFCLEGGLWSWPSLENRRDYEGKTANSVGTCREGVPCRDDPPPHPLDGGRQSSR